MKKFILFVFLVTYQSILLSQNTCDRCDVKLTKFVQDDSICRIVDFMPTFKGERQKYFLQYIYENIQIKKNWLNEIDYQYTISYVVNKNGKIVRIKIGEKNKIEYTKIEKEIYRVIKNSPKWSPGRCQEKPVPIYYKTVLRLNISG